MASKLDLSPALNRAFVSNTRFYRMLKINNASATGAQIISKVEWYNGSEYHKIELTTQLSNY